MINQTIDSQAMYKSLRYARFYDITHFMSHKDRTSLKNVEIRPDGVPKQNILHGIEDCLWLENLKIDFCNVKNPEIYGIEYCSSLAGLVINGKNMRSIDLAPLTHLTSLKWLKLKELDVSTLAGIDLPHLERLSLEECSGFSDLRFLCKLRPITLVCKWCSLVSLEGLNHSRLVFLSVLGNRLTSIKELEDAQHLETLFLCGNKITCLDTIGKLQSSLEHIKAHESYGGNDRALQVLLSKECSDNCVRDDFLSSRAWSSSPLDEEDDEEEGDDDEDGGDDDEEGGNDEEGDDEEEGDDDS